MADPVKVVVPLTYDMALKVAEDIIDGRTVGHKTVRHFAAAYMELVGELERTVMHQAKIDKRRLCGDCLGSGFYETPFSVCECSK